MSLLGWAYGAYVRVLFVLQLPLLLGSYLAPATGREYGVGLAAKLRLLLRIRKALRKIPTASHFLEHVALVGAVLNVPRALGGGVVECGCYKGGSTASLSLACAAVGRTLHVFDSFAGLPEPDAHDRVHLLPDVRVLHSYEAGAWCGTLDEVKANVGRYGAIESCRFHPGYFAETLPDFHERCVLAFLDVDLVESLKPCLKRLWPLLAEGGLVFSHEASHHEIAGVFFDAAWWRAELGQPAPGLVGAGSGLGLVPAPGAFRSDLGYTVKNPAALGLRGVPQPGLT